MSLYLVTLVILHLFNILNKHYSTWLTFMSFQHVSAAPSPGSIYNLRFARCTCVVLCVVIETISHRSSKSSQPATIQILYKNLLYAGLTLSEHMEKAEVDDLGTCTPTLESFPHFLCRSRLGGPFRTWTSLWLGLMVNPYISSRIQ